MILYFSGTGNTKYAAETIAAILGDEAVSLNEKIRANDTSALNSEKPWVLAVPTYAWQIPHIVRDWLMKTELNGSRKLYTVMTCGDNTGNAGAYVEKICAKKNLTYCGCEKIVMPDNYFVMFEPPTQEKIKTLLREAEIRFEPITDCIRNGKNFPEQKVNAMDKIYSSAVNSLFYGISVTAKPFYSTDKCISCGQCEKVCPLNNIRLTDGRPVWGNDCTHCMACICTCPREAIEYGKKTAGKPRYKYPKQ